MANSCAQINPRKYITLFGLKAQGANCIMACFLPCYNSKVLCVHWLQILDKSKERVSEWKCVLAPQLKQMCEG